ncbi:hypothetical protein [Photobacterium carnosum]|uniref:hypothetical protein n=1 Tax=Photobacterium carnosum TaxID=2023717 RepID=UPI001E5F4F43|nr:hypothetical protein [Photobacterium carnosum]MCD9516416.1 hypothetical protein [Photobacterium carnosum]
MTIKIPTPKDLVPLYQEAMEGQSEEQWQNTFLNAISKMINKDPLWYRAYGFYWWGIKQLLIENGLLEFEYIDAEWLEKIRYENSVYLLLAAFAYHDERLEMGAKYDDSHVIEMNDDTFDSYIMIDDELEQLAVAKSFN